MATKIEKLTALSIILLCSFCIGHSLGEKPAPVNGETSEATKFRVASENWARACDPFSKFLGCSQRETDLSDTLEKRCEIMLRTGQVVEILCDEEGCVLSSGFVSVNKPFMCPTE